MIAAGMDVARFNLSHGTPEDHRRRLAALREAAAGAGEAGAGAAHAAGGPGVGAAAGAAVRRIGVLFDLRGPEIRLGTFRGGRVTLEEGATFVFSTVPGEGDVGRASVDYAGLPELCRPGDPVLIDDGNLVLEVVEVREREVVCRVKVGGVLTDRKKLNLPGHCPDVPYLSAKDREDLELAVTEGADFVAASFTRTADDIRTVRDFLRARGGTQAVVAKIENQEALADLDDIIAEADAVMVARGDLGVEVPEEEVPVLQKDIIARAVAAGKPVITATQMLESMVERPRPTRAEASDVANAIFDGTDAVMLSAETATGRHPVEAVATMARIVERAERALGYGAGPDRPGGPVLALAGRVPWLRTHLVGSLRPDGAVGGGHGASRDGGPGSGQAGGVTDAISRATVLVAEQLRAGAIVTATTSGFTARMVARYRPRAPIIAVASSETVARQLALAWGVHPVRVDEASSTDQMFLRAVHAARDSGLVEPGSIIVITAGAPPGTVGTTNLIKVHTLGRVLARGRGVLPASAFGPARPCRTAQEAARVAPGDVLVAPRLTPEWLPAMQAASAWVVEEDDAPDAEPRQGEGEGTGEEGFVRTQARLLGRVAVVGVEGALEVLREGLMVTLDGARGLVYEGRASVL